jgi:hypothetical protein
VIAGSNANGAAVTWRQARGGEDWKESTVAQSAPASAINDVIRDGSGYLATGSFVGRGQSDLGIWRSSDGLLWTQLGGADPVFSEAGFQSGLGMARAGGRIVVAGRHGAGNAGLWIGADSASYEVPGPGTPGWPAQR